MAPYAKRKSPEEDLGEYVKSGNAHAHRRVVKPRNRFADMPNEEILYMLSNRGDHSKIADQAAEDELMAEMSSRGLWSDVQNAANITDFTTGTAKMISDATGLSAKIPKVEAVSKKIPIVGTAASLVQGVAQQASKQNPYGSGLPSGWHIVNDTIEGSYGFTGPFYPLVQTVFGGVLSNVANTHNSRREAKEYQALFDAKERTELEEKVLYALSRDWGRGENTQTYSSGIQAGENAAREEFRTKYLAATTQEEADALMAAELQARRDYDDVMDGASWFNRSLTGVKATSLPPSEAAKYIRNWTMFEKVGQENARNEGIPPL
jgi:hypothetical protein